MMAVVRFFSFAPRVSVVRWIAWFAVTLEVMWLCWCALLKVEGAAVVAVYAVVGVALGKLATESVRRLHDCGQSGWLGLKIVLGIVALFLTACLHWLGYGADVIHRGALALSGTAMAVLFLRPGMRDVNVYGRVPGVFSAGGKARGRAGIVSAAVFLIAGVAFGLAVVSWQAAMDRQREARIRMSV